MGLDQPTLSVSGVPLCPHFFTRIPANWYTVGFNVPACVAYVVGAALALYWTQFSPLSFGSSLPVFFLTIFLYLAMNAVVSRRSSSPVPTSGFRR